MSAGSPAGPTLIELREVALAYWRRAGLFAHTPFWALEDISFEVRKGETLGVIGRNGAGKSTLLRLLAGIIEPDRGEVRHFEAKASLLSLQLGFVPYLSGRENAILSGLLLGMRRAEITAKLPAVFEYAELQEVANEPVGHYSSGMKARLGFAVALEADPDVLLIDEVLGVGDEEFRRKSSQTLRDRMRSQRTVVLVSHSAPLVRDLCDRAVWIEHGRVCEVGETEGVLAAYHRSTKSGGTVRSRALAG